MARFVDEMFDEKERTCAPDSTNDSATLSTEPMLNFRRTRFLVVVVAPACIPSTSATFSPRCNRSLEPIPVRSGDHCPFSARPPPTSSRSRAAVPLDRRPWDPPRRRSRRSDGEGHHHTDLLRLSSNGYDPVGHRSHARSPWFHSGGCHQPLAAVDHRRSQPCGTYAACPTRVRTARTREPGHLSSLRRTRRLAWLVALAQRRARR